MGLTLCYGLAHLSMKKAQCICDESRMHPDPSGGSSSRMSPQALRTTRRARCYH